MIVVFQLAALMLIAENMEILEHIFRKTQSNPKNVMAKLYDTNWEDLYQLFKARMEKEWDDARENKIEE